MRLVAQLADTACGFIVIGTEAFASVPGASALVDVTSTSTLGRSNGSRHGHEGLVASIARIAEAPRRPQRVLLVVDELDDTTAAAFTVLSDERLARLVRLDAVVVTVDAVHLATRLAANHPVESDLGLDRFAIADRILVARGLDVTPQALGHIGHVLRSVNRFGPIIAPAIAAGCSLDELVDLCAWSGPPTVGPGPDRPSPALGLDTPAPVLCRADRPLAPDKLERWLEQVLTDHAANLIRLQGAVELADDAQRTYLHGVRSCLIRSPETRYLPIACDRRSIVALVGRSLPAASIQAGFASTVH